MWADSKTVGFLKFGSMFQKLFNVEPLDFLRGTLNDSIPGAA